MWRSLIKEVRYHSSDEDGQIPSPDGVENRAFERIRGTLRCECIKHHSQVCELGKEAEPRSPSRDLTAALQQGVDGMGAVSEVAGEGRRPTLLVPMFRRAWVPSEEGRKTTCCSWAATLWLP